MNEQKNVTMPLIVVALVAISSIALVEAAEITIVGDVTETYTVNPDPTPAPEITGGGFWTFGTCDCDRLKILNSKLTGDPGKDIRTNYMIDILLWDYKYTRYEDLVEYCTRYNFDMFSPVTNYYMWVPD